MLDRRISILLLALVLLVSITPSPAYSQPVYYVGNDIHILSETVIRVRAWIKPYNVSWEEFKKKEYYPNQDKYVEGLIHMVRLMFGVGGFIYVVNYGVDDSEQKVFVTVMFDIRDSAYYDAEYKVIKFMDVFKRTGRGWFDEVHVRSDIRVYSWSPKPTRWDDYSAYWFNPSMDAAPLWYEIALAPRHQIVVRIDGLPSAHAVRVKIDGRDVGTVRGGEEKVYFVTKSPVSVEIPAIIDAGKTRYVAEMAVQRVEANSLAVFRYYAEHLVELDVSPRVGEIEVNGTRVNVPYSNWWREGTLLNLKALSAIPIESTATTRRAYVFRGWNDGVLSPSRSITVNRPLSLIAEYVLSVEYYVRLVANSREAEARLKGSGWYREGGRATIAAERIVLIGDEVRLVFVEWSGLGSAMSYEVIVDSPKEYLAIYKRQYRVRAIAPYGTILDDWYDEGSTVSVRLQGLEDGYWYESREVRRRFIGWRVEKGDILPTWSLELSFTVSSPVLLYAEFSPREYLVTIDAERIFIEEGYVLWPSPDIAVASLLVVDRFVGYEDLETGRFLGRSVVVNRPLRLARRYQRDYIGLLILSIAVLGGVVLLVYGRSLHAAGYSTGFKGVLAKMYAGLAAFLTGAGTRTVPSKGQATRVIEDYGKMELEKRIRELEVSVEEYKEYLARLELLRERGEVSDEVYRELKAAYERELEKYEIELKNLKGKRI